MNAVRKTRPSPADQEQPESGPNVEPSVQNYDLDRLTNNIWGSINALSREVGGLDKTVSNCQRSISDLEGETKELTQKVHDVTVSVDKHMSFVKGAAWVLGIMFLATSGLLAWTWTSIIRPGLAHAIVEQVKPELSKQVKEATESIRQTPQKPAR